MSFVSFLKQVLKMLFGYGGGFLLIIAGIFTFSQGNGVIGGILTVVGFLLALFGVYSEREL